MECKGNAEKEFYSTRQSIDLTRMECKAAQAKEQEIAKNRIDLTRMECKDSCYFFPEQFS